jgi:cell division protein FtsL
MMNILVLTHKDMRTNPINLLLTGIAVADMMVMVEYIPFAIHMYLIQGSYRTLEEKVSQNITDRTKEKKAIYSFPITGVCFSCSM